MDVHELAPFPMHVGDSEPALRIPVVDRQGKKANLQGFVGVWVRLRSIEDGTVTTGAGTLTVDADNAEVNYAWATTDLAAEGQYELTVRLDVTGAGRYVTMIWPRRILVHLLPTPAPAP